MTVVALFNNKGGVGKTTLAYHVAHMLARLDVTVLAVDLDPQANLTAHFLGDDELEELWQSSEPQTVAGAVRPIVEGMGDILHPVPIEVAERLWLLPGDLRLSGFEERLAQAWPATLTGDDPAAARVTTAFHRIVAAARETVGAQVVLLDVGPNLGALNRSALLVADHVLVPLGADLFSAQGLRNLGPALGRWRTAWKGTALPRMPAGIDPPAGDMTPLGYVVMQPSMRLDRPVRAYEKWVDRIPAVYAASVLGLDVAAVEDEPPSLREIGTVRNYRSLMPLAHEARKPMFDLKAADGAIGSTQQYGQVCLKEFRALSQEVLRRLGGPVVRSATSDVHAGSVADLLALSPVEFESLIVKALTVEPAQLRRAAVGERRVSLLGRVAGTGADTVVHAVQVTEPVGPEAVDGIEQVRSAAGAARALLVTTSRFTPAARARAQALGGVDIVTGEELLTRLAPSSRDR